MKNLSRPVVWLVRGAGLAAALLLASLSPVMAGEGWQPFAQAAASDSWSTGTGVGKPMRLGLRAEQWSDVGPAPTVPRLPSQCRKWQSMAIQLGETFAGYTLRHTVLQRVCGDLGDGRIEESWDWPWAGFASGRMAPPRMLRTIEAWDIRCGRAGARQRCAMLHEEPAASATPAIVTHFVIDLVAGRESVLWRVFVATDGGDVRPNASQAGQPEMLPARASTRTIRYRLGETEYAERFSKCVAAGCIMEANLVRAGQVATRLWDGNDVMLAITPASGDVVELSLPARGFRAAFAELVRQRRDEFHAGRR